MTASSCFRGTDECSLITPRYSLGKSNRRLRARVARPSPIGRSPDTGGSRVPLWPALWTPSNLFVQATISWLVGPRGLSSGTRPYSNIAGIGRLEGGWPCSESWGSPSSTIIFWGCTLVPSILHVMQYYFSHPRLIY